MEEALSRGSDSLTVAGAGGAVRERKQCSKSSWVIDRTGGPFRES